MQCNLGVASTHMLTLTYTYTHTHQHSAYSTQTPQAMRTFSALSFVALAFMTHQVAGFISPAAPVPSHQRAAARASVVSVPSTSSSPLCKPLYATVADQPEQPAAASKKPDMEKDVLKSDCGMDYVPLANMMLIGDWKGADQFTRDALIKIAGPGAQKRGYVYFTEVKNLPAADMATIEKLWLKYSKGKFGYTVQRQVWNQVTVQQDFERFCRKIGWNMMENGIERKLKWFGKSEFCYDLEKAPVGHLPLTSALRGTSLLKNLMTYPLWETEWKDK